MKEKSKRFKRSVWQDGLCLILSFFIFAALIVFPGRASALTLAWDPNPEPDLAGYKVYSGTSSRNYTKVYNAGKSTRFTISGLQAGRTYYFAVKAYNTPGLLSGFSNEVSYKVPASTSTGSTPPSTGTTSTASGSLLYTDCGSAGTLMWDGSAWTRISETDPQDMVAAGSRLYGDYGEAGTWMWDGSAWTRISMADPQNMVAAGTRLYADYGASGIWMWDGGTWERISEEDSQNMIAAGSLLYADCGTSGIWMWDGSIWERISEEDPQNLVAPS